MSLGSKILPTSLMRFRPRAESATMAWRALGDEPPLRSELLSVDRLEQHAKSLAGWHEVDPRLSGPDRLLPRLAENEAILLRTYELVSGAVEANRRIAPAGEWLLDNFYLIEEQVRIARRHLPRGYSRELPRLRNGPSAGTPRVYGIVAGADRACRRPGDADGLRSFVAAYQTVAPLKLGELWAIPIMLRLALIENLRRVAARIAADKVTATRQSLGRPAHGGRGEGLRRA